MSRLSWVLIPDPWYVPDNLTSGARDLGSVLAGGGGCAWAGQSIKQQAATNCRASICFLTKQQATSCGNYVR